MKTILAITLGAILFVGALENPAHSQAIEGCGKLGELAEELVRSKYAGVPLSQLMAALDDTTSNKSHHKVLSALVLAAYQRPDYSSTEYQDRERALFRNEIEMACYRAKG